jgi:Mg2+/citrate symporter
VNKTVQKAAALLPVVAVSTFAAGTSPIGIWLQSAANEATSIWAVAGAAIGLVVGLIGALFGSHEIKSWCVKAVVVCVCLLAVQALITWL